jgi:hypothetical protein
MASRAELALAAGEAEVALEITRRLEPTRPADTHPVWAPWRSLRARALVVLGETEEARRLAAEDFELARRVQAPWVIGRALRILAELGGPDRVELARDAVAQLGETSARLELAKAHAALAVALAAAGDQTAARVEWTRTAELAAECGAVGLGQRAAGALRRTRTAR